MCLLGLSNLFLLPKTDEKWYVTVLQVITPLLFPVIFLFAGTFILCVLMMVIKPNNFKNIIYEFTHWGMFKKGKGIEYSRSWRDFIKLKETKSFIFLYTTENDAHVIQKRMFRDTDEMENFKKFADQNIWSNS